MGNLPSGFRSGLEWYIISLDHGTMLSGVVSVIVASIHGLSHAHVGDRSNRVSVGASTGALLASGTNRRLLQLLLQENRLLLVGVRWRGFRRRCCGRCGRGGCCRRRYCLM